MTPGQVNYETWAENYPGPAKDRAHKWADLPVGVQAAWEKAAEALTDRLQAARY